MNKMSKNKKRKIEKKNRGFRSEWIGTFPFVQNIMGQLNCLICYENFKSNNKSNIELHFVSKHNFFGKMYQLEMKEKLQ